LSPGTVYPASRRTKWNKAFGGSRLRVCGEILKGVHPKDMSHRRTFKMMISMYGSGGAIVVSRNR
jgi:hypothetical protein